MKISDLYSGMLVRVIDFSGDEYERPDHWCGEGGMDDWQGEVVTIREYETDNEYVYIEEDEQEWQWYPWDFDYYCQLSQDNPNKVFKRQLSQRRMNRLKAKNNKSDDVMSERDKAVEAAHVYYTKAFEEATKSIPPPSKWKKDTELVVKWGNDTSNPKKAALSDKKKSELKSIIDSMGEDS